MREKYVVEESHAQQPRYHSSTREKTMTFRAYRLHTQLSAYLWSTLEEVLQQNKNEFNYRIPSWGNKKYKRKQW